MGRVKTPRRFQGETLQGVFLTKPQSDICRFFRFSCGIENLEFVSNLTSRFPALLCLHIGCRIGLHIGCNLGCTFVAHWLQHWLQNWLALAAGCSDKWAGSPLPEPLHKSINCSEAYTACPFPTIHIAMQEEQSARGAVILCWVFTGSVHLYTLFGAGACHSCWVWGHLTSKSITVQCSWPAKLAGQDFTMPPPPSSSSPYTPSPPPSSLSCI